MKKIETSDLEKSLKHASKTELDALLNTYVESEFTLEFERLRALKSVSRSDLIKQTVLDRTYAYQIIQGVKKGRKDKIVQLCLALSTSLEATNRLLKLSGNPSLYAKIKRDAILIYAIENSFTVMQTNELLNQLGYNVL